MITLSNKISPADAEFITELVAQCYPLILSTAKKCGPAEDTEDIIAESSLHLLRYIGLLRDMESSRQRTVYIYKVVQHTAYKHSAKRRRYRADQLEHEPVITDMEIAVERRAELQSVLGKLKPRDRDILLFYYLWGYSIREIAEIMGLKLNSTGVYLQRARDQARKLLAEWQEDKHE